MTGFLIQHMGREYRIGVPDSEVSVICTLLASRNEFIVEGGSLDHPFISSFQTIKDDLEITIEIAEFDQASEPISEKNPGIVDPDYAKKMDSFSEWDWKLEQFYKIEAILKSEGLL
jgi:hypothetical protein